MPVENPDDLEPFRTDLLFLLVGTNPLPSYVAALRLARHDGRIVLLNTTDTAGIANRMAEKIREKRPSLIVEPREIDHADGCCIQQSIAKILSETKCDQSVGLNYTGGTKPMAVHVYHTLKSKFPQGCFSYLDARTLTLFINQGSEPTQKLSFGRALELTLDEIMSLHGYQLDPPRRTPQYGDLYQPLAKVCSTPNGYQQWKGAWNDRTQSKGWLRSGRPLKALPTLDQYPLLGPVIGAFEKMGGTPEHVADYLGKTSLDACYTWFNGTWLEEYTLEALARVAKRLNIPCFGIDVKPLKHSSDDKGRDSSFQLDLAAVVGYQLFAISCITSEQENAETKKHLFEAFVRARQVGGDEARFGLVCLVQEPESLKDEIVRQWDAVGKIEVFGRRHLLQLETHLGNWIRKANREGV